MKCYGRQLTPITYCLNCVKKLDTKFKTRIHSCDLKYDPKSNLEKEQTKDLCDGTKQKEGCMFNTIRGRQIFYSCIKHDFKCCEDCIVYYHDFS